MRRKIIGIFVVGILLLTGFASVPSQAGPALQPLTSPDPQIIDMIQQVNESLLYYYNTHLTAFGPRYTGTENCTKASQYIYDEFQAMGLSVKFHNWTFDKFTDRNVVATLPGTDTSSNAIFIICAHYDTVEISPGAIDDGSGVSAVLATAKILSQHSFNYTIRFIAFSGEEVGLYGSYLYARDVSRRGDNIVGVINLDEIGYSNTMEGGRTFCFLCPSRSKWIGDFALTVSTLYIKQTNMTVELYQNLILSDHQSFVEYGFDAIFGQQYDSDEYYYEHISHSRNDTSDRINWTYITNVTKLVLAVVSELASTPLELQVIITTPYQGYSYFFNHPLLPLDFWKSSFSSLRGTTFIVGRTELNVDVIPYDDVETVLFCIDGNINGGVWEVAQPHYNWSIHTMFNTPLVGKHTVEVYVYTTSGKVAFDEINTIIYTI
ncbi:Peptidase family M28 [uncultured archaeon]|nr:Peptidase family M28 [uncultured archaeon]